MKLRNLFLIAVLTGTMAVLGCDTAESTGNDAGTGGAGGTGGTGGTGGGTAGSGGTAGTPADLCNFGACLTSESFKNICLNEYNNCVDLGGDPSTCKVAAEETCGA